MSTAQHSGFETALKGALPSGRVLTDTIDRLAFANDASVYRLVPRGVAQPASIDEIKALYRFSHEHRVPMTFAAPVVEHREFNHRHGQSRNDDLMHHAHQA